MERRTTKEDATIAIDRVLLGADSAGHEGRAP
jgi:hypothetical protein